MLAVVIWNPHIPVAPPRPLNPSWELREWPLLVNRWTRAPGWQTSYGDRYMIRLREIEAVNRAQCIISGGCWRRLSDAIVRRARNAWLIGMSIDMRLSTMRGLGRTRSRWATSVDTDIGPHHAEAAAYLDQERIALRWAYNSADWALACARPLAHLDVAGSLALAAYMAPSGNVDRDLPGAGQ